MINNRPIERPTMWPLKANKLKNKLHSGKNSYFIVENEGSTFPKETSLPSDIIFPEETPIPSPVLIGTHIRVFQTDDWSRFN